MALSQNSYGAQPEQLWRSARTASAQIGKESLPASTHLYHNRRAYHKSSHFQAQPLRELRAPIFALRVAAGMAAIKTITKKEQTITALSQNSPDPKRKVSCEVIGEGGGMGGRGSQPYERWRRKFAFLSTYSSYLTYCVYFVFEQLHRDDLRNIDRDRQAWNVCSRVFCDVSSNRKQCHPFFVTYL